MHSGTCGADTGRSHAQKRSNGASEGQQETSVDDEALSAFRNLAITIFTKNTYRYRVSASGIGGSIGYRRRYRVWAIDTVP